jgi:phage terminase Nu1 subunit (DNA packaging protein)
MADVHAIAKACNLTVQRVHQLVKLGMPKQARGEYQIGPCMAWYIKYLQKELERRGPAGTAASAGLQVEREGLTAAQRQRVELDVALRRGELADREDVRRQWSTLVSNAQKRLRAIPASVGPQLTNMADPAAIVARMKHEIDTALQELAGDTEHGRSPDLGRETVGATA